MPRAASAVALCLAAIIAGATSSQSQRVDILRLLVERPWLLRPRAPLELASPCGLHDLTAPRAPLDLPSPRGFPDQGNDLSIEDDLQNLDEAVREPSPKRSAVATALNAGRRRRQPSPALGKAVSPYVGVGVLNDVGSFFDTLRDNLETLAALSPEQRASLFSDPPAVVHAPASGGGGGGGLGYRKLHALRPLRPTGNIRSYNRRSFVETDGYPGANHHDPGLLWTGLGR
ncbi:uncharacterized protein LOC125489894 [Plutella xylostella]|uniref:uncharacterized protein LOC125489894 n=1 Tax=Plutella xylostella TaxID=51655 RepID=UPI00203260D1|nr:uncharacterized protein LOC125489894 [Plutella xylostella]